MKSDTLTLRLDREMARRLDRLARSAGKTRSEVAREALRRQLAVAELDILRRRLVPFAEASGYLIDEDLFRDIS